MSDKQKILKIDKSILPSGYSTTKKEGFYAEFYPDGQLKHFGFYVKGSCKNKWRLCLEHGKEEGWAELTGCREIHEYKDGKEEYVCGWGCDHDDPTPKPFVLFVKNWVNEIWLRHKREIGFNWDKPFTDEEYRQWDLNVRMWRVGMLSEEASKLIYFKKDLQWRFNLINAAVGTKHTPYFESTYDFKNGYGLIVREEGNPLKEVLKVFDFELFGDGWSEETKRIVEGNRDPAKKIKRPVKTEDDNDRAAPVSLDASLLPPKAFSTDKKEGFYAEFYPDGQLKHFGYYERGSAAGKWQLSLAQGKEEGREVIVDSAGSITQETLYKDGFQIYVRGWKYDPQPKPMTFAEFVEGWVWAIWGSYQMRRRGWWKPFAVEEYKELDLSVRRLRVGMAKAETEKIIHLNEMFGNKYFRVQKDNETPGIHSIRYDFTHDYVLIIRRDEDGGHLVDFELSGGGWSRETREIVKKNRKQKSSK